jgi:hypothetical protein
MADDPMKAIWALVILFVFAIAMIPVSVMVSNMFTEQKCAPYVSTIDQQKSTIIGLNDTNSQLSGSLGQCKNEYNRLITENITKKDIEDIKQDWNLTKTEITVLNQKFDSINTNFISVYNNLYVYFKVSIVINVFLIFFLVGDLISVTFFNFDIKKKIIEWIVSKFKRKKKEDEVKNG